MKLIHVVCVQATDRPGGFISFCCFASTDKKLAIDKANEMNEKHKDDPIFQACVVGPIELID